VSIRLSDLTPEQRAHVAKQDAEQRRARKLNTPAAAEPAAGVVYFFVNGDPPRITHQAKKIGRKFVQGGGRGPLRLYDDERLKALHQWYATYIRPNTDLRIAPPASLHVQFRFEGDDDFLAVDPRWFVQKPDADNAAKPVTDVLVKQGWLEDDKQVAMLRVEKIEIGERNGSSQTSPGVYIALRTITHKPIVQPLPPQRGIIIRGG